MLVDKSFAVLDSRSEKPLATISISRLRYALLLFRICCQLILSLLAVLKKSLDFFLLAPLGDSNPLFNRPIIFQPVCPPTDDLNISFYIPFFRYKLVKTWTVGLPSASPQILIDWNAKYGACIWY